MFSKTSSGHFNKFLKLELKSLKGFRPEIKINARAIEAQSSKWSLN